MEKGADKIEITATKIADGTVATKIKGTVKDALEMLAMLNRRVAKGMIENGGSPDMVEMLLLESMTTGMKMAVRDWSGK